MSTDGLIIKLKRAEGNHKGYYAIPFEGKTYRSFRAAERDLDFDSAMAPERGYDKIDLSIKKGPKKYMGRIALSRYSNIDLGSFFGRFEREDSRLRA